MGWIRVELGVGPFIKVEEHPLSFSMELDLLDLKVFSSSCELKCKIVSLSSPTHDRLITQIHNLQNPPNSEL